MEKKKVVIIGSGPSGWTAAIYLGRAEMRPLVYEGFLSGKGGQLMTTTDVENYPGFPKGITGAELVDNMRVQALRYNVDSVEEDVISLDLSKHPFIVEGQNTKVEAQSIIIATGAMAKKLDIPGSHEGEFWQRGVSACAVCDGAAPIFRSKDLFVIGGGDTAVEEALFLTKYAKKVFIVHRRDTLRAEKVMAMRAMQHPKIEILWNQEIVEILGTKTVEKVILQNTTTKNREERLAGGVFFAVGYKPNTDFLQGQVSLTADKYIVVEKGSTKTSKEGVFAAGDVQDPIYRQAIIAAGSGCMAALDVEKWLSEKGWD